MRIDQANLPSDSRDNGRSFAGMYGLGNPTVTWLINRGHGELVALSPEEMRAEEQAPPCSAPKEKPYVNRRGDWAWRKVRGLHCLAPMRYRTEGWVCYEHKIAVRVPRPLRLQQIPAPPFSTFEVIGKTVEVVYVRIPPEVRASWKWLVDGEIWEGHRR